MLAISATSASAFTLSSPSLAPPVATSHIEQVCWQQGHPGPCWYHRHCWRGRYHWHCG
jgi:hypothetical protein